MNIQEVIKQFPNDADLGDFIRNLPKETTVKFKKLKKNAVVPFYAKDGDAGLDLTATDIDIDEAGNYVYGTGLAFEIPYGYVGLIFPRSSICKKNLTLSNSVGVIDSGYRGEVIFKFKKASMGTSVYDKYNVGDKIGQIVIMPYPTISLIEVDELEKSERGVLGHGSTGN